MEKYGKLLETHHKHNKSLRSFSVKHDLSRRTVRKMAHKLDLEILPRSEGQTRTHSPESRKKISESLKKRKLSNRKN